MGSPDIEKKASPSISTNGCDVEATQGALPSGKVDAALEFLRKEGTAEMSELDEKKLVRKIDWMIMPLMWGCYNLQYLDKVLSTKRPDHSV